MLRMISKVVLLGVLLILVKLALLWSTRAYEIDYIAESIAKEARLHGSGRNRVILVGGSNLAFGVDSSALEACTGRQLVNMGLHAGLGLNYMLEEAAHGPRPGDLVVIIPEYEHFFSDHTDGPTLLSLVQFNPLAARYLRDLKQWLTLGQVIAEINNRKWLHTMYLRITHPEPPGSTPFYSAHRFNEEGDFIGHMGRPSPAPVVATKLGETFNHHAVVSIARFCSNMRAAGVDCVVVYPTIMQSYWVNNRHQIEQVDAQLTALRVVMTKPEQWIYPDASFYDAIYHLNWTARQTRTEQFCTVLAKVSRIESLKR
jgi:hypothetical protein